ncbi:MAG: carbohydrate-binding family 9-like protein [Treponema sp.]|jgi:hypothetical protein|nr:carbohydrate-binding family 9-like protein [Treponema sp.]
MTGHRQFRRQYYISRINAVPTTADPLPAAAVDVFPWGDPAGENPPGGENPPAGNDYRPVTTARMAADDAALYVYMKTSETGLRAEERGFSGQVYTDSCMELFLMPDPAHSSRYLNWEFNPRGAMYLSLGTSRHDRENIRVEKYLDFFQVKTEVQSGGWGLEYGIPVDFLRRYFPALKWLSGHVMRGNFYKCGDKTDHPHYACWSPIDLPRPDFHCPLFFGDLILKH